MVEYSRRQLAMMTTKEIKEKYITRIRLGEEVKELKQALKERGITVPNGTNPKSLID